MLFRHRSQLKFHIILRYAILKHLFHMLRHLPQQRFAPRLHFYCCFFGYSQISYRPKGLLFYCFCKGIHVIVSAPVDRNVHLFQIWFRYWFLWFSWFLFALDAQVDFCKLKMMPIGVKLKRLFFHGCCFCFFLIGKIVGFMLAQISTLIEE